MDLEIAHFESGQGLHRPATSPGRGLGVRATPVGASALRDGARVGLSVQVLALLAAVWVGCAACSSPAPAPSGGSGDGGGGLPLGDGGAAGGDSGQTGNGDGGNATGDSAAGKGDIAATVCVAPGKGACDAASECGSEQYCDPCSHTCETPRQVCDPCTSDAQCDLAEQGSVCLPYKSGGTFCGRVCLGDAGCPKGFRCVNVGAKDQQCVPKTGSCGPLSGGCKTDADCPFGSICNAEYAQCKKGCGEDTECPTGKICTLFRCNPPCESDTPCQALAAEAKCEAGRCKIPGGCLGFADCVEKATYCDAVSHKCQKGCKLDADCKEFGVKCQAGSCVAKGCLENWECAFGEVCDPAAGKCKAAEGPYCAPCDAKDDKATACGGAPHKCFSFQDQDGNKVGDFCGLACSDAASGPCPQGYGCQELKDQDGKSTGKFCMRECWKKPFESGTQP